MGVRADFHEKFTKLGKTSELWGNFNVKFAELGRIYPVVGRTFLISLSGLEGILELGMILMGDGRSWGAF